MILISTYNPQTNRSTEDEALLTTLLAALIRHAIRSEGLKLLAKDQIQYSYYQTEKTNANILIGKIYPLLGLDWSDVSDLLKEERERWQIDPTGKK